MASGVAAPGAFLFPRGLLSGEVCVTSFHSILIGGPDRGTPSQVALPQATLKDLHIDEIITSLTEGRDEYDLAPLFRVALTDVDAVGYRHEVFHDLEQTDVAAALRAFAAGMREVREHLARGNKVHYRYERERWQLDAVARYVAAVIDLDTTLTRLSLSSRGLTGFRDYLRDYRASSAFAELARRADRLQAALAAIRYRLRLEGGRISVTPYAEEPDYGAEILATFEKFRQGTATEYRFEVKRWPEMNHVEAAILDGVARQHPETFADLDEYTARYASFQDETVRRFDRELQFYLALLERMADLRRNGLMSCYPEVVDAGDRSRDLMASQLFDLALAVRAGSETIITNDVSLNPGEQVIVISGPNSGGKTTLARAVGQLHHLARIGAPVPAARARVPLVDRIFTHFERQEQVDDLSSKLEIDMKRVREFLDSSTPASLLILNESFSSTTVADQLEVGRRILRRVIDERIRCVFVTFLHELASSDPAVVSMTSMVDPGDPARRTFKVVRRPADGLAYAISIADKHGLTYDRAKARLAG